MRRLLGVALLIMAGGLTLPAPARAQLPDSLRIQPDSLPEAPAPRDQEPPQGEDHRGVTPRGAFIRSAIIPGWGHASVGAQGRGAFYFLAEAVSGFMLVKTHTRLSLARDRRSLRESVLTEKILASGVKDPAAVEELLLEDEVLEDLRGLEEARSEQREDWMALAIFFLFLGGADAYVSAHLSDFPGAVEIDGTPTGGMEVGVSIPVNFQ